MDVDELGQGQKKKMTKETQDGNVAFHVDLPQTEGNVVRTTTGHVIKTRNGMELVPTPTEYC